MSASSFDPSMDPVLQLPLWQAELSGEKSGASINSNNHHYNKEELKSQIDHAQMTSEFGVRKAQVRFYEAFSKQDLEMMRDVWSSQHETTCCQQGTASIRGNREEILKSWKDLFDAHGETLRIEPSQASIDICGSTAICHCVETIVDFKLEAEAVNIYKREDGEWKMTFHMAYPIINCW